MSVGYIHTTAPLFAAPPSGSFQYPETTNNHNSDNHDNNHSLSTINTLLLLLVLYIRNQSC